MKKEFYSAPEALVIELAKVDIVTTSGEEVTTGGDNYYDQGDV